MYIDVDNVLQRMTIVGVILSFRQLAQSALHEVLEDRVPFLLASVQDYHKQHQLSVGGIMGTPVVLNGDSSNHVTADTMVIVRY